MSDFRKDRSDKFKKPFPERGNPHGGHGRRARQKMAEQFETQTGHPLGEPPTAAPAGRRIPAEQSRAADVQRGQHARKGQAQSPRELNLNQPEPRRKRHR
jgi:hypothetical protein